MGNPRYRATIETKEEYRAKVDKIAREALQCKVDIEGDDPEATMHEWLTEITFIHLDDDTIGCASTLFNSDHADNKTQPMYYAADFTLRDDVKRRMDEIDPTWRTTWEYGE